MTRTIRFFLIVRALQGRYGFVWELWRGGTRGGSSITAPLQGMAERHIEGAVRGGKGHYEGRCAAERPLRGYVVRIRSRNTGRHGPFTLMIKAPEWYMGLAGQALSQLWLVTGSENRNVTEQSEQKITRTKRSSILVVAKVLYAVPTDLPNCMMAGRAVVEGSSV